MKTFKIKTIILSLTSILFLASCEQDSVDEDTNDSSGTVSSASQMQGTWSRDDGQLSTFVKIDGSTAITCNNGNATNGTFNASQLSMTYIVSGETYVFPMRMQGAKLIVQVPAQGNANHVDTPYIRSTTWPCGGGGTGGGGTGGGGATTGSLTVWSQVDHGCGNITVDVSGQSGVISSYYSGGSISCGATGCANFTLAPGNYNVSASCQSYTWNGTATVSAGGCFTFKLN
jgi:hypothetical protein